MIRIDPPLLRAEKALIALIAIAALGLAYCLYALQVPA